MRYLFLLLALAACGNLQSFGDDLQDTKPTVSYRQSQMVYNDDECIGTIVMGICHGSILPKAEYHPTCYGQMLNGSCIGSMF